MPANTKDYPTLGLTSAQVRKRTESGLVNAPPESPTKSVQRIVLENVFSFFNLIFFVLAGILISKTRRRR